MEEYLTHSILSQCFVKQFNFNMVDSEKNFKVFLFKQSNVNIKESNPRRNTAAC